MDSNLFFNKLFSKFLSLYYLRNSDNYYGISLLSEIGDDRRLWKDMKRLD